MSLPRYLEYKDSGVEWLGEVPEHWSIEKFRYVCRESGEKIEDEVVGEMLSVSGYRGIEIKAYDDDNKRRTDEELQGYRIVRPGQLVVNTMWLNYAGLGVSVFLGHVSPAYRSYWVHAGVDLRFLHHLMRSSTYVQGYSQLLTGVRPNSLQMSRDDLMAFPILLAPADEQSRIARFLDHETAKIDALIQEQQRLIKLLKEKRQAVISHAVTKGLDPTVPMKDSGVEWLGEVPEHWVIRKLKNLVSVCGGSTPSKEVESYWHGDTPWVSPKDMKSEYISDSIDHVSEEALSTGGLNMVNQGAVLIVVRGMILIHSVPVAKNEIDVTMNQDMKAMTPGDELSSDYLLFLLQGIRDAIFPYIDSSAHGTRKLEWDRFELIELPIPPRTEQTEIIKFIAKQKVAIDTLADQAAMAVTLMSERRSALISAAVTGKIDVRGCRPPDDESTFGEEVRPAGLEAMS